jgi:hypothetical protein
VAPLPPPVDVIEKIESEPLVSIEPPPPTVTDIGVEIETAVAER